MTVVRGVGELLEALATADDIEIDGTLSGMLTSSHPPGKIAPTRE
jgi:hypothetical protein